MNTSSPGPSSQPDPQPDPQPEPVPMIRLDQFMKLTGLVATGGQAKLVIQGGEVLVNGEVETRRRRQLHLGDVVAWGGEEFAVEMGSEEPEDDYFEFDDSLPNPEGENDESPKQ